MIPFSKRYRNENTACGKLVRKTRQTTAASPAEGTSQVDIRVYGLILPTPNDQTDLKPSAPKEERGKL
jgi:hypothetical protein